MAKKALILNNKVVDVCDATFDVHSSMTWVDCEDTIKIGYSYDGSKFTSNEPTTEELATMRAEHEAYIATKNSGNNKLLALGLTQEEATALTGYKPIT